MALCNPLICKANLNISDSCSLICCDCLDPAQAHARCAAGQSPGGSTSAGSDTRQRDITMQRPTCDERGRTEDNGRIRQVGGGSHHRSAVWWHSVHSHNCHLLQLLSAACQLFPVAVLCCTVAVLCSKVWRHLRSFQMLGMARIQLDVNVHKDSCLSISSSCRRAI